MLYIMEETRMPEEILEKVFLLLPKGERERLKRKKRTESLEQSLLARMLLLYGLKREKNIQVLPEIGKRELGKPYFPKRQEICFNVSHSANGIFCGISEEEIGVDIQKRIVYKDSLAEKIAHKQELSLIKNSGDPDRKLTELWCIKEAYVKYTGEGIRQSLKTWDFSEALLKGKARKEELFFQIYSNEKGAFGVCQRKDRTEFLKVKLAELCSLLIC